MPPYVVSACLAGHACRYDGSSQPCAAVVELVRQGMALPLCPETMAELPVPRSPCELKDGRVMGRNGQDLTEAFDRGARMALEAALAHGCTAAILKTRSPSCGMRMIYDGTFSGRLIEGQGVWARLLKVHGLHLYSEDELPEAW